MDMKDLKDYGIKTRRWLLSVIRQRRFLLEIGKSKAKDSTRIIDALDRLEKYLGLYTYATPRYMARFINERKSDICLLLPGRGSSMYEKRQKEFEDICADADLIMAGKQMELSYGNLE